MIHIISYSEKKMTEITFSHHITTVLNTLAVSETTLRSRDQHVSTHTVSDLSRTWPELPDSPISIMGQHAKFHSSTVNGVSRYRGETEVQTSQNTSLDLKSYVYSFISEHSTHKA